LVECCRKESCAFSPRRIVRYPRGTDGSAASRESRPLTIRLDQQRRSPRITTRVRSKEDDLTNPFEDENGVYHVLINDEGQHSLWPSFVEVPKGWTIIHKSDSRAACLEFITRHWTDMRPNSLIESMKALPGGDQQADGLPDHAVESKAETPTWDTGTKH
jgi:MbtH protein